MCLGLLQNGSTIEANTSEAMADSLLVFVPHEHLQRALCILNQVGILSPDGTEARPVKNVTELIANSPSATQVAPMEAGPDDPALLNGQCILCIRPHSELHQGRRPRHAHRQLILELTATLVRAAKWVIMTAQLGPIRDS